ncbi:hypothetical protein PIB30_015280 [Stylosanthes scabra]|uniref:Uncharacterized protein n=1 Tax=Stylosanthes scabra TaxID=79078 RepID=A0ABU6Y458_9FABA|nr:hypothetical protein [Stylosanthes scabra]
MLPFSIDSAQLAELFETVGTLLVEGWFSDFHVIYDKMIERSKCLGLVTMSLVKEAETAKQQIHAYAPMCVSGFQVGGEDDKVDSVINQQQLITDIDGTHEEGVVDSRIRREQKEEESRAKMKKSTEKARARTKEMTNSKMSYNSSEQELMMKKKSPAAIAMEEDPQIMMQHQHLCSLECGK